MFLLIFVPLGQKKDVMGGNQYILRIHIENSKPVEVSDFTKTMSAFGTMFSCFAQKNGKSQEEANARLYVSKIVEGSIDIHLVEIATASLLPFVENTNLIIDFAKHIKSIYDYYVRGIGGKPDLSAQELKGVHDMVSVPANDRGGKMTVQVIHGDVGQVVYNGCSFNAIEGNGIQNQSAKYLDSMKFVSADGEVHNRQLMTIYQVQKGGSKSGNKGIIDSISEKRLGLVFDTDDLRDEILRSDDNPMKKGYIVDVVVLTASGKPAAYKILNLHDVIDLD